MVLHGYGVDCLADGFMMVLGKSAAQSDFPAIPFPPVRGFGSARMHVHGLQVAMPLPPPLPPSLWWCCPSPSKPTWVMLLLDPLGGVPPTALLKVVRPLPPPSHPPSSRRC